ncbi:hypothetical protein PMZ80_006036 [Knufia obscura]|uniref:Uncharacterized protein n=2 Tax=Knufia TaxID=430999 RepID=A0AAN8EVJ5_9EURO|nr:hypothetical protein PMZ80_006036 [Knufia obscura]KAK5954706.1 hypothetical protein OHC33_004430 [Knufia fluminis]
MICCEQAIEKGELCAEPDITTNYYGARITKFKYDCPKCRSDSGVESYAHSAVPEPDHSVMAEPFGEQVLSDEGRQDADITKEPTTQETITLENFQTAAPATPCSQSRTNTEVVYDLPPEPITPVPSSFLRKLLSRFRSSSKQPNPQQVHSCRSKTYNLEWSHNRPFLIEKCTCTSKPYNNIFELIASKFDEETGRYTITWETGSVVFDLDGLPTEAPSGK